MTTAEHRSLFIVYQMEAVIAIERVIVMTIAGQLYR